MKYNYFSNGGSLSILPLLLLNDTTTKCFRTQNRFLDCRSNHWKVPPYQLGWNPYFLMFERKTFRCYEYPKSLLTKVHGWYRASLPYLSRHLVWKSQLQPRWRLTHQGASLKWGSSLVGGGSLLSSCPTPGAWPCSGLCLLTSPAQFISSVPELSFSAQFLSSVSQLGSPA